MFHLCVTCPSEIFVSFVFKHIDAASIETICVDNLFHSFIILNEDEYFLISNLH